MKDIAVIEMKKALMCLRLEIDSSIVDDIEKKFDKVITSLSLEEKLYNQLKLIDDAYGEDWEMDDQKTVGDLLYDYQTKNIP